jgi:hypothetical protein
MSTCVCVRLRLNNLLKVRLQFGGSSIKYLFSLSQQSISKIENAKDDHISLQTINEYARILGYELHFTLKPKRMLN